MGRGFGHSQPTRFAKATLDDRLVFGAIFQADVAGIEFDQLHRDLLPQCSAPARSAQDGAIRAGRHAAAITASQLPYLRNSQSASGPIGRSEEHTSELQSLMRISYAVFCLKKKNKERKAQHDTIMSSITTSHLLTIITTTYHV